MVETTVSCPVQAQAIQSWCETKSPLHNKSAGDSFWIFQKSGQEAKMLGVLIGHKTVF